jgi:shikimate kinase
MNEGYYDPYPRLALDRPLVLVGHPGSGVDRIGRTIAGRTGLAFNDVERSAESLAGGSRSRVLVEEGIARLREVESAALGKAIRRKPFGVVVMETGLLEDAERRHWLQSRCTVVYVRRSNEILLARIQRQRARAPGSLPEFLVGAPRLVEELRDFLAPREAALGEIGVVIEAEEGHPMWVAGEVLASLEDLLGVERLRG